MNNTSFFETFLQNYKKASVAVTKSLSFLLTRQSIPLFLGLVLVLSTVVLVSQSQKKQIVKQEAAGTVDSACVAQKCKDRGYCNGYSGNSCDTPEGQQVWLSCLTNSCYGDALDCSDKCYTKHPDGTDRQQESCFNSCKSCENSCSGNNCKDTYGSCGSDYDKCIQGVEDKDIQAQCTLPGVPTTVGDTDCEKTGNSTCSGGYDEYGNIQCPNDYPVASAKSCTVGSKNYGICCTKKPAGASAPVSPVSQVSPTVINAPQTTSPAPQTAKPACTSGESLGGILTDKPSVIEFNNHLHVFVKGTNQAVYALHGTINNKDVLWGDWEFLDGQLKGNVLTQKNDTSLFIAGTGMDDKLYQRYSSDGSTFSPWMRSLLTQTGSSQSVKFNGRTYTFSVGNNKNLCVEKSDYTAPSGGTTTSSQPSGNTASSCTQGNYSCVRYACQACSDNNCRSQVQIKYPWATCAATDAPSSSTSSPNTSASDCRDNPVTPPSGLTWKADCAKSCTANTQCPASSTLNNSNWCYGFASGPRCLQLQKVPNSVGTSCNTVNGNNNCPEGNYSCIRYACTQNDMTCANCVAPWLNGNNPW